MKTQADPRTQSAFSPTELAERTLHRRAVEAVIWGMPAVNFDLMYQAEGRRQATTRLFIGRGRVTRRTRRSLPIPTRSI